MILDVKVIRDAIADELNLRLASGEVEESDVDQAAANVVAAILKDDQRRRSALDDLVTVSEEMGLYEIDPVMPSRTGGSGMPDDELPDDMQEQLESMAHKIGSEGLDYFLQNYIDMVPDVLHDQARNAASALAYFEERARALCEDHGVEFDQ